MPTPPTAAAGPLPAPRDLEAFFTPRAIAVVGVSERPDNLARVTVGNLIAWGFPGAIYPVGREGGTVHGLPILTSIEGLPDGVDLASVCTPAATVPAAVEALARRGVRAVCVQTGGFAELSTEGRNLGEALLAAARAGGVRIVGPNGLGTLSTVGRVCLPWAPIRPATPGPVGLVSQSGGVMFTYLRDLADRGHGLSHAASVGNKLDVDEADLVRHLGADPATRVILLYLEDVRRGRAFLEAAATCGKPVVLHKANRSTLARAAAASHTASLAGDQAVVQAATAQAGIHAALDAAGALRAVQAALLPPMRGRRVAIVSRSGGHAVIAADACARHGFELPAFPDDLLDDLGRRVRAGVVRLGNPLDLGDLWDLDVYVSLLDRITALPDVDGVVLVFVEVAPHEGDAAVALARHVARTSARSGKPVALTFLAWPDRVRDLRNRVEGPTFDFVEDAVEALAISRDLAARRARAAGAAAAWTGPTRPHRATGDLVPLEESLRLLERREIPFVETRVAATPAEAGRLAAALGGPVAVKLLSPQVAHKTDVGGVELGVEGAPAVEEACRALDERLAAARPDARRAGFAVQRLAAPGAEVIVGFRHDATFGPVVLAGLGGTQVELLRDVALRVAPIEPDEARQMLAELAGYPLLAGARGAPAADLDALGALIARFSRLAAEEDGIAEAELNPVLVYPAGRGCLAVDARCYATRISP